MHITVNYPSSWYSGSTHTLCREEVFHLYINKDPTSQNKQSVKCINGWLRRQIQSKFCLIVFLHRFHTFGFIKPWGWLCFWQRCCPFVDCSAPSGKSLNFHAHASIQNSWQLQSMSDSLDILDSLCSPYMYMYSYILFCWSFCF